MPGWHPKELCQESRAETLLLLLAFSWLVSAGAWCWRCSYPAEASIAFGWDHNASVYTPQFIIVLPSFHRQATAGLERLGELSEVMKLVSTQLTQNKNFPVPGSHAEPVSIYVS